MRKKIMLCLNISLPMSSVLLYPWTKSKQMSLLIVCIWYWRIHHAIFLYQAHKFCSKCNTSLRKTSKPWLRYFKRMRIHQEKNQTQTPKITSSFSSSYDKSFRKFSLSVQLGLTFAHSLHGLHMMTGSREPEQTASLFTSASLHTYLS